MTITVTGSTGSIGSELVRLLSEAGVAVRAVMRDFSKVRSLRQVAWVQADLRDESLLEPVISGTQRLFLLSGIDAGFGEMQSGIIRAAERLGVSHVVKLSALGASSHSKSSIAREHWEVEEVLRQTAMSWTLLRPHAFMQNMLGDIAASVRNEGVIYAPIGDGRVPFIDTRDVAAVAAETLLHPDAHASKSYFPTGGTAVGYAEIAQLLSETLGREVTYNAMSMDEARARLTRFGIDGALSDAILAISAYQKAGGPTERVSDAVERVLGRAPRSISEFVQDYREQFVADPG